MTDASLDAGWVCRPPTTVWLGSDVTHTGDPHGRQQLDAQGEVARGEPACNPPGMAGVR